MPGRIFLKCFPITYSKAMSITALQSPTDIAISKKMSEEFFGSPAEAIGKTIRYQNKEDFKITAVFDDAPQEQHNAV